MTSSEFSQNGKSRLNNGELSPFDLREISGTIPKSERSVEFGDAFIEVFRVKSSEGDIDSRFIKLLEHSRGTYHEFYGDIPLMDQYDSKSDIYMTRTTYEYRNGGDIEPIEVEEWASLRFVPAFGDPHSNEDVDFYNFKHDDSDFNMVEILRSQIPELHDKSDHEIMQLIVTQSRFCAIRPIPLDQGINGSFHKFNELVRDKHLPTRNGFSGLNFAVMNMAFLEDTTAQSSNERIITCQMHPGLSDVILTYPPMGGPHRMPFTPAHETLDMDPGSIYIDRSKEGVYAYDYPAYFLELSDLVDELIRLDAEGILPRAITEQYLGGETLNKLKDSIHMPSFRNLGRLLTAAGPIDGSRITGERLRERMDTSVPDGAVLRIMKEGEWTRGVQEMIWDAQPLLDDALLMV